MSFKKVISSILSPKENSTALEPSQIDPIIVFEELAKALPDTLEYEWDDRFGGVLAAFATVSRDQIFAIVGAQLDQHWNNNTIASAPNNIKTALKEFGGLAKGQQLFACGLTENVVLLGLWWPWGHGGTISIRFVPYSFSDSDPEVDALRTSLKGAFGLS